METTDIRKLITKRTLERIEPHPNADALEIAVLGGWHSVIRKGEFHQGQQVLYAEIDTAFPTAHESFAFLAPRGEKTVFHEGEELKVHVLKTIRLRGELSQGLILPLEALGVTPEDTQETVDRRAKELGIFKYEPPLPGGSPDLVGGFPGFLRKTDSERVQNLTDEFLQSLNPEQWFPSEKVDGTSSTWWKKEGVLHGAGRNWELNLSGENTFSQIAKKYNLENLIPEGGWLQGEIVGEGIQGNPLKLSGKRLLVFSHGYFEPPVTLEASGALERFVALNSVPRPAVSFPTTLEEALTQVEGRMSLVNPKVQAEGIVWWNRNGQVFPELGYRPNFKVINNKYLLKQK